jgi:hypothetical protein
MKSPSSILSVHTKTPKFKIPLYSTKSQKQLQGLLLILNKTRVIEVDSMFLESKVTNIYVLGVLISLYLLS